MSFVNNYLHKFILFPLQSTKSPVKGRGEKKETHFKPNKNPYSIFEEEERERERDGLGAGLHLVQVHIILQIFCDNIEYENGLTMKQK